MSGIQAVIAPVGSMPQIACEPCPACQTNWSTPHAEATLTTLRTTALSGSTRERNARARRRKVTIAIKTIISGKLP
jgi:hypothetical protein